jgi:periplasmic protein TonB
VDYAEQQRNPGKHVVGFGVVIALHLALGWALVNGLAQRLVDVIKAPIETKIVEEIKPPPPPPENLPPPKVVPPPPSFVPPPEVNVNAPAALGPTITTTTVAPPPAPVTVAPPPPAPAPAPPAPPARTEPKIDFNTGCQRPEYNDAARRAEAQGTVVVVYTMDTTGSISEAHIEKSSGPSREHRMLDRMTLEAVLACKGTPGTVDGKPQKLTSRVTYVWKLNY